MRRFARLIAAASAFVAAVLPAAAKHHHHHHGDDDAAPGLANVTLLIVRHAEKPTNPGDHGLSPAGTARAKAYASYFRHFEIGGRPVRIDTLIASADSDMSARPRPRLTLEPLSEATGIAIQTPFKNKHYEDAVDWLAQGVTHGAALIAWHHGKLPDLLAALGAPNVLPGGAWPDDVYDWVVVLRYDEKGRLASATRVTEPSNLK